MHSFIVPFCSVKATNEEPRKEGDYNQPSTWLSFQTPLGSGVGGTLRSTGIMWQNQFIKLAHLQRLLSIWSHQYCSVQLHKEKERVGNKGAASLLLKDNEIFAEKKRGHAGKSSKKPGAQMGRNCQNMQSGISGYSSGLIEGLGSFGSLAAFCLPLLTNKKHKCVKGRVRRTRGCVLTGIGLSRRCADCAVAHLTTQ